MISNVNDNLERIATACKIQKKMLRRVTLVIPGQTLQKRTVAIQKMKLLKHWVMSIDSSGFRLVFNSVLSND